MQIFLFIFAILSMAGAWQAWRRSPLYSAKITLKLVGATLLTIAAVAGVCVLILNGPIRQSPVTQGVLIGLAIIVIGVGATGIIVRTTDAHVAQLPPSARLLTIHRHRIQRWIWRIVVYLLISAAAMLVLPWSWSWLPGVPALLVLFGCGPSLMALYMRARRLDRGMSVVVAAPWVHWEYGQPQWEAWAKDQLAWDLSKMSTFSWQRDWRKMTIPLLVFAGGCLFLGDLTAGERITAFLSLSLLIVLLVSIVTPSNRSACFRRNRRLLASPREAYFGDEGFYFAGEYSQWTFSGSFLVEATAPRELPRAVVLVFRTFTGSSSADVARRIPLPEGREADLGMLQTKLREHCRTAKVNLVG